MRQTMHAAFLMFTKLLSVRHTIVLIVTLLIAFSTVNAQMTVQYEESYASGVVRHVSDWTTGSGGSVYLVGASMWSDSVAVVKIDATGSIAWRRSFEGPYSGDQSFLGLSRIAIDTADNLVVASICVNRNAEWVIIAATITVQKYNSEGNTVWGVPITFDISPYTDDPALELSSDQTGFIYVAAIQGSPGNTQDISTWKGNDLMVAGIAPSGSVAFQDVRQGQDFYHLVPPYSPEGIFAYDSSALILSGSLVDSVECRFETDTVLNREFQTSLFQYTHAGYHSTPFGPWGHHSCSIDYTCSDQEYHLCATVPYALARRPDGNLVIGAGINYGDGMPWDSSALTVLTPEGSVDWVEDFSMQIPKSIVVDSHGDLVVWGCSGGQCATVKYDSDGTQLWQASSYGFAATDNRGNPLILYGDTITCLNSSTGSTEWKSQIGSHSGTFNAISVDQDNRVFVVRGTPQVTNVGSYRFTKRFEILDATASHSPIAERDFELYEYDPGTPGLPVRHVGTCSTNVNGAIEFDINDIGELMYEDVGTGLELGDLATVAIRATSVSSPRHFILLPTMYSVWLDPIKFNEYGIADLESIDNQAVQEMMLDHTEYRYNLLVGVEWDADEVYLEGLRSEFRYMSNFLYDVSDGQIRLNTVAIYDNCISNPVLWERADVRIHATNQLRPAAGILGNWHTERDPILMPRKWFSGTYNREWTYFAHPLGSAVDHNFRTLAHEFGHYMLGFYDEYAFITWAGFPLPETDRCLSQPNYGFMDDQYLNAGELASEMSSSYRYLDPGCQNTKQWIWGRQKSCWDMFEIWAEGTFGDLYVPILKPNITGGEERQTPESLDYIPGPNNDQEFPDFNVGALVEYPVPIAPPANGIQSLHVQVMTLSIGGFNVKLRRRDASLNPIGEIDQGNTTDEGKIYVLGANRFYDYIWASGYSWVILPASGKGSASRSVERAWQIGDADLSQGKSIHGRGASLSPAGDSLVLTLYEIDGYFPIICDASFGGGSVIYSLQTPEQVLPSEPDLELITSYGGVYPSAVHKVTGGYEAIITDSLGTAGMFRVLAEDNSAHAFFFGNKYVLSMVDHDSVVIKITGPDGGSELALDTMNTGIESVLILSSPYIVPLTGLPEDVAQGGQAHSISTSPNVVLAGANSISVWYDEADLNVGSGLMGDESDLQIYRWDDQSLQWDLVGGYVDTAFNYVASAITELGTYAAFTTDIITDVEENEYGDILPYRFQLSQNYPNPFNPVTTIEYSLPRRSSVRIDIFNLLGQRVCTLVNREEAAGSYTITWDGTSSAGKQVATGVYFYRFQTDDHVETKKMLLLK